MRHLPAAAHKRMAWKNGGGETVEIAVSPPDAGLGEFGWRVSTARVAVDGPFSSFPGVDRTLALLEGEALVLRIEGMGEHRLAKGGDPLLFPADAPTEAVLPAGPITDLNVMTRRGRHRAALAPLGRGGVLEAGAATLLLLAQGPVAVETEAGRLLLSRGDALLLEPGESAVAAPQGEEGSILVAIAHEA